MAAKLFKISDDGGTTYYTVPGATAELSLDATNIDDSILGQTFQSGEVGLITWNASANGFYKGFAGYNADLKKIGTTTAMTTEAMSLVSGKTYQIDDTSKRVWDRSVTFTVFDNAVDQTANVVSYDYLFGKVTFDSAYTVTGPVTITGSYFPLATFSKAREFTLTQTANPFDTSDYQSVQANGGYRTHSAGLRNVSLELSGIQDVSEDFIADLAARNELIIEINPDGNSKSLCRGYFKIVSTGLSGEVGDNEEETVSFQLHVPDDPTDDFQILPFAWSHENDTTLDTSIKRTLDLWESQTDIDVQYLYDGTNGHGGTAVITDITLSSSIDDMNEFSLSFIGDGALADVP